MAVTVQFGFSVSIQGGPTVKLSQPLQDVEAYDFVTATLPAESGGNPSSTTVDISPATAAGDMLAFILTANPYSADVTYAAGGSDRAVDGPLVLIGPGAVSLLGATPPENLVFENASTDPVNLQIVVARKA